MPQTELQPSNVSQPTTQKIKPLVAYIIIVAYTAILFVIGIMVGKLFFWGDYNKYAAEDRQIQAVEARLSSNPKDTRTITDLGWAYFKKGDYNRALIYYKQALDLDGNYYPAQLNMGLTYLAEKKYDLAVEALKKAISLNPKGATAQVNLGIAYIQTHRYQEAVDQLKTADNANPGNVEIMYNLGFAYEKMQKYQEAANQYQSALQYDPKYAEAKQGLQRVQAKVTKK